MAEASVQTFWDHLDELRATLIRIGVVTVLFAVGAFMFKDEMFAVILAPRDAGFITYRWLGSLGGILSEMPADTFSIDLINTQLAQQFIIHMKAAFCVGLLCASPYIIYQLFRFISPALYENERRYAVRIVGSAYVMFIVGMLISYYLIFPLTFRFLGSYQVAGDVTNMISLESYMDTLLMLSFSMGLVFEMPVLSWLLGRMGLLKASAMRRYRKHAIVVILTAAAIITPTSDAFTLAAVSLPMWLLYELSILLVRR